MKKLIIPALLCTILILALTACSSTSSETPAPEPYQPAAKETPQATATEPVTAEQPKLPEGVVPLGKYDLGDPITLKYTIDPEDMGMVETATFDIRNAGDKTIKPVIIFYVGGESDSAVKRFEYDELPPGYKMLKTEEVNMKVSGLHENNAIKATLRNGLDNDKLIGEQNLNYQAKPSFDSD
ncbi:MAG: hypothetical protein KKE20_06575 [Nanoarchaeota archaeon]|nr:hypothetical protein [Nanoarchaeota archaeon]